MAPSYFHYFQRHWASAGLTESQKGIQTMVLSYHCFQSEERWRRRLHRKSWASPMAQLSLWRAHRLGMRWTCLGLLTTVLVRKGLESAGLTQSSQEGMMNRVLCLLGLWPKTQWRTTESKLCISLDMLLSWNFSCYTHRQWD